MTGPGKLLPSLRQALFVSPKRGGAISAFTRVLTRTLLAKRVEYNSVRPMVVLAGDYDRTTFAVVIS